MIMIEIGTKKEQIVSMIEDIHMLENMLIRNFPALTLEQAERNVEKIIETNANMEVHVQNDQEALFYTRLLRAKCEEIYDIIELKRAM